MTLDMSRINKVLSSYEVHTDTLMRAIKNGVLGWFSMRLFKNFVENYL